MLATRAGAHRGDNYCAPENTLPAFELAIRKGAHQIELDLRMTKDEQLVILHDDTVDRTTDGRGKLADLTLAQVRALDAGSWKDAAFAGTRIPTFAELLKIVPPELLLCVNPYLEARQAPRVVAELRRSGKLEQSFLACDQSQIEAALAVEPAIRWCTLDGERTPDSDYPDRTIALGAQFILLRGWADCMPQVVERLHRHGVTVDFYGTEDPVLIRKLIAAGIDYVLTDHLDALLRVLAE